MRDGKRVRRMRVDMVVLRRRVRREVRVVFVFVFVFWGVLEGRRRVPMREWYKSVPAW
jgi:hypothetical protein